MKLKPSFISLLAVFAACGSTQVSAQNPEWLEPDSAYAISYRIGRDFPTPVEKAQEMFPELSKGQIKKYIKKGYIETLKINGKQYIHKKAARNYKMLDPKLSRFKGRGYTSNAKRQKYVADIVSESDGKGTNSNAMRVTYRFSIDVPTVDAIKGDTLKVWMPLPLVTERQPRVEVLGSTPETYVISTPSRSVHNTVYFEQPVTGDKTHFEYVATFDVAAKHFAPEYIEENIKPYNKDSELYKKYTAFEAPHIVDLEKLAREITKGETDPFKCSEMVYDYIITHYPWAGAREYSTIPCIPEYVLETGHGDCGQVTLLYISLMRSLGIPARWESGWMLHPGEVNLHDWAEVYFEGIGWVPVDTSFGRYDNAPANLRNFYSTGIDQYRMATNKGVCGDFYPAKQFLRSESVDSQMGEVETSKGNLFYPGWNCHLEIIKIEQL